MNTERLIHMPQCSTIDLSALCNSSNSIWNTIESHRWVKLSCENIGMCLSYGPFTLVIRLINCWDFIQIWYHNKMLSSQWDNDNQHFVYIIVSWYLLGIITRQGFLFSCSCMNRCTCHYIESGYRAKVCLCLQFSVSTCCVVIEQMSPKKIRYIMTLSYFPDVLPYYFFQNVKFCSRKIPLFLYVRLCHVLHDSRSGPRFNNKMAPYQYRKSIVEIRRSHDRFISTMGFPIPATGHLYIESGPCFRTKNTNTNSLLPVA